MISTILIVFAMVLFILAGLGLQLTPPRFNLMAFGLAAYMLALLVPAIR